MEIFGSTRSRVERNYALLTPDTHVVSPLIGWQNASAVVHISPEIGSRFTQYTATLEAGATSAVRPGIERFIYVQTGKCTLTMDGPHAMPAGSYAFIPADTNHQITSESDATLVVFEKRYVPLDQTKNPDAVIGHVDDVPGEPFMGDEDARLKTLLPIDPAFDMAVNLFTYQPGATLPQVEIHTMEHGLLMLDGQGVYRLGEDHFPVGAGDVIWMASYCPQWFVAMGKQPASYLYYKDIHRDMI
jgi:(S)-ureidoglycine aminohydrolase